MADNVIRLGRRSLVDLDEIGDRYVELCEARESGDQVGARRLERRLADDIPAMRDEIAALTALVDQGGRHG